MPDDSWRPAIGHARNPERIHVEDYQLYELIEIWSHGTLTN